MPRTKRPPSYRFHKARNCAVVMIDDKNFYLGPYGSPESLEKYARLISQSHVEQEAHRNSPIQSGSQDPISVSELILRYLEFACEYYRKHGQRTGEFENIPCAVRPLKRLYGHTPAGQFKPKDLELVRQAMIDDDLARKTINGRIGRICGVGPLREPPPRPPGFAGIWVRATVSRPAILTAGSRKRISEDLLCHQSQTEYPGTRK